MNEVVNSGYRLKAAVVGKRKPEVCPGFPAIYGEDY